MKIPYYKIGNEYLRVKKNYLKKIDKIFKSGNFILGDFNKNFEKKISKLLNVKYVCGLGNGTDALEIALLAAGVKRGDEVITATNSWTSSVNSIINIGAKPILVDVKEDFNIDCSQIIKAINKRTKAIIPVHLNGLIADMSTINRIAKLYKLKVIEDSAQAIMSKINNKFAGTFGDIGCFSMHPTKTLGAAGDGGFITTNNSNYFNKIILLRNHGMNEKGASLLAGRNSRLDEIQAAFILNQLKFLTKDVKKRRKIAEMYKKGINSLIQKPNVNLNSKFFHTYHRYVIKLRSRKERNNLKKHLQKNNIETKVHYRKPLHMYKCFKKFSFTKKLKNSENYSNLMLSLPCNHFMKYEEVQFVIKKINQFIN